MIAEMVGLGRSTVGVIVSEVTEAIIDNLWEEHVSRHFPGNEQQFKENMLDMEERWQLPCCWAATDGCHIPLMVVWQHVKNTIISRTSILSFNGYG